MKWQAVLTAVMMMAGAPSGGAAPKQRKASVSVDRIWAYAGTWKIETESFETPYSKAGHEAKTLQNDCWKSGGYVACRQIVDGDPKVLIVFTCNGHGNTCTSYQIPPDGSEPGSGEMVIDGDTWKFPWTSTVGGKTTWFRVVNVWSSPTTIEYRQEFSTDQVHWTRTSGGHEVRVSPTK
jgi:hypothetical protein